MQRKAGTLIYFLSQCFRARGVCEAGQGRHSWRTYAKQKCAQCGWIMPFMYWATSSPVHIQRSSFRCQYSYRAQNQLQHGICHVARQALPYWYVQRGHGTQDIDDWLKPWASISQLETACRNILMLRVFPAQSMCMCILQRNRHQLKAPLYWNYNDSDSARVVCIGFPLFWTPCV